MLSQKKLTVNDIQQMKLDGKKITAVTAYDYPTAQLADRAGIDIVLIGDSLAMVVLGRDNTIPITVDEMIPFARAVSRGAKRALVVADMPFMSYNVNSEEAIRNAGRFLQEGRVDAVKLEGGIRFSSTVRAINEAGIQVMGHIGLTPQAASFTSGYRAQGKTADAAVKLMEDALALQSAGAFSVVLELVPAEVAQVITEGAPIPTIGIGSGKYCDGQVLVIHDLLGLYDRFTPKFARQYVQLAPVIVKALQDYHDDVVGGRFPAEQHTLHLEKKEHQRLLRKRTKLRDSQ